MLGKRMTNLLIVVALLLIGTLTYVRLSPNDAAAAHVDPTTVANPATPNFWRLADGGSGPAVVVPLAPDVVAARLTAIATATPRTTLLAGADLHTTWVTRSALMGYPDFTTVLIAPAGTGSTVSIFARSRFGQSDMGVNRARVEDWVARLSS